MNTSSAKASEIDSFSQSNNSDHFSSWLSDKDLILAFTLTFRSNIKSSETVERYLRCWNNRLRKTAYGKQALKLDKFNAGKYLSLFTVLERHEKGDLHVHGVMVQPPFDPKNIDLKDTASRIWEKITRSTDNWRVELPTKEDYERYVSYSMKYQKNNTDNVFVYCWDSRD